MIKPQLFTASKPMASVLGGSFIGATVARGDFFKNAQCASERCHSDQEITSLRPFREKTEKIERLKMAIRSKFSWNRQFRWKRIRPSED